MKLSHIAATAAVLSILGAGIAFAQTPQGQTPTQPQGQGSGQMMQGGGMGMGGMGMPMCGMGMMHRWGHYHPHGFGMMRGGGMTGMGMSGEITTDSVRQWLTARLEWRGNPRLKVGTVTQAGDGTITAEIVTAKENAVVDRFAIDPKTGQRRRLQ